VRFLGCENEIYYRELLKYFNMNVTLSEIQIIFAYVKETRHYLWKILLFNNNAKNDLKLKYA